MCVCVCACVCEGGSEGGGGGAIRRVVNLTVEIIGLQSVTPKHFFGGDEKLPPEVLNEIRLVAEMGSVHNLHREQQ